MREDNNCKAEPGLFAPVINRNRCEAKGDCVAVCPYQVFRLQAVDDVDKQQLSIRGKLKLWIHGGQQAYTVNAQDCHACGLCVSACPEKALRLERVA